MSEYFDEMSTYDRGAWVIHHGRKTGAALEGAAEFSALDTAGKAASLLSQLAATDEMVVPKSKVDALAKAAHLNPILELKLLLEKLAQHRLIDVGQSGEVNVLGVTSRAIVGHAATIFEDLEPTSEEKASVAIAELTSESPRPLSFTREFISDEFEIPAARAAALLERSEAIGFVDAEGHDQDRLYFNGNLFRRDNIEKTRRVLDSLSSADNSKVLAVQEALERRGCVSIKECKDSLGQALFDKLRAAGMYDINHVANSNGEFGFVTMPAAFHKFNDPLVDDAFDLAKALVASLTYGMTQSASGRGRIFKIEALLKRLIAGAEIGPATAIGEDYRVLEMSGVLRVTKAAPIGFTMKLLKKDVGEMALRVLMTGETSSSNALDHLLPGAMRSYTGPEFTRTEFRRKQQTGASKLLTQDVLQALRTRGKI